MSESRVAFVSGGAGGIGREICAALAADGHRVAMADLPGVKLQQAGGGDYFKVALDVTSPVSVTQAVRSTEERLGPIGICVNCVGWDEMRAFVDTDEDFLKTVLEINLTGPVRVVRAAVRGMIEQEWGRVINIASDAGRVGMSMEAIYSGAKGGVIAFTKTIARELASHGITANCVCPGPTETPLLEKIAEDSGVHDLIHTMADQVPMKRLGTPQDIAPAVAFLASDEAGYITGQSLSVNGGLTMV
jgi:2-hydroxycyclohexanecarboxyl-CoA dehydrogenase